ncbi:MAG: RNA polymerase factor sigma-54 [Pseudomonadota bacterium]
MKQSLQVKLGQSLTMTPQLQQAIKLLQLHSLELQQEIREMLESNPMLELEEERGDNEASDDSERRDSAGDEGEVQSLSLDEQSSHTHADDLPVDSVSEDNWEPMYGNAVSGGDSGPDREIWETREGIPDSDLHEHLQWQLDMSHMSERDRHIGAAIIDAVDDDGWLSESPEAIHESLSRDLEELELDEVLAVLHRVQHLDPLGVAAADMRESLLIQTGALPEETPQLNLARSIIDKHLHWLGSHDYARLKRHYRVQDAALSEAIALIQGLDPKPGAAMNQQRTEYIVPDVYVSQREGRWQVELNPDLAPKLSINALYASLVKRGDRGSDASYLRDNLQEARWFIKSLQSRNDTILKVAAAIVERQRAFLEYGDEAMKPMVLRDIAEAIDMHESTISRVTTQKYMHTPRGLYELKHFFSSHVSTADGGECSATAIRAMIKKLVSEEDRRKPLSDSKLTRMLDEKGINVARRTVAKYREALRIPPSNERKELA